MKKIIKMFKKQKKILINLMAASLIGLSALTVITYIGVKDKVNTYTLSEPITIYDKEEVVVDTLSVHKGENAEIEDIPIHLQNAFVAVEDKRFYSHWGIDIKRVGKAFLVNLSKGRIAQGGSTISQQLAKNAFLTNERTLKRKFKELIITFEIERLYTKEEILEKYLNEIYFGSGSYGVREAARDIFDKDISKINLPEAAMLAGIPNRPSTYNPRTNLDKALERGRLILKLMYNQGFISEKEYNKALQHKFVREQDRPGFSRRRKNTSIIVKNGSKKRLSAKAPDFTDIIEERLSDIVDVDIVSRGGLKVYTTIDMKMQKAARRVFNSYSYLRKSPKLQGAMVTLDSKTGDVRSVIGGKNYTSGNFNRAINTKKQIGSTFKPFVYYTALENGYTMNQMIDASTASYGKWTPRNYGGKRYGQMTLMESMEKSVNTVAVKLLKDVGISKVVENFYSTQVDIPIENDLTTALGSMSASPIELATAYLPFANGGYAYTPSFIVKVEDAHGNILYEREDIEAIKALKEIDVALTTYMMKDVVENGSGRGAKITSRRGRSVDQGGKTGTSNDFRSAWYAGFTPDYVTVVYMGYDDNTPMPNGSSGGRLGAPLWKNFYQRMIDEGIYSPTSFEFLDENIDRGELIKKKMDIRNGQLGRPPKEYRRYVLFKKGQVPEDEETRVFREVKNTTRHFFKRLFDKKGEELHHEEPKREAEQSRKEAKRQKKQIKKKKKKKKKSAGSE